MVELFHPNVNRTREHNRFVSLFGLGQDCNASCAIGLDDLMDDFTKVSKQKPAVVRLKLYMYCETACYKLAQHPQNIIQEPPAADTAKHVRVSNTAGIEVDGLQLQRLVPFSYCSCLHGINLPGCSSCWRAAYLKGSDSCTICKGPGICYELVAREGHRKARNKAIHYDARRRSCCLMMAVEFSSMTR